MELSVWSSVSGGPCRWSEGRRGRKEGGEGLAKTLREKKVGKSEEEERKGRGKKGKSRRKGERKVDEEREERRE